MACISMYYNNNDCTQTGTNLVPLTGSGYSCNSNIASAGIMVNGALELWAKCSNGEFVLFKTCGEPCGWFICPDDWSGDASGCEGVSQGTPGSGPMCPNVWPNWEGGFYLYPDGNDACAAYESESLPPQQLGRRRPGTRPYTPGTNPNVADARRMKPGGRVNSKWRGRSQNNPKGKPKK